MNPFLEKLHFLSDIFIAFLLMLYLSAPNFILTAKALTSFDFPVVNDFPSRGVDPIPNGDDENDKEMGVIWVEDYSNIGGNNLVAAQENAEGFFLALAEIGWAEVFNCGDYDAVERQFEAKELIGLDHLYADDVDFVWFAGHGDRDSIWFGRKADPYGEHVGYAHYSEIILGDRDIEWIVFDSCLTLNNTPLEPGDDPYIIYRWESVFKGLHAAFGFATEVQDCQILVWIVWPIWYTYESAGKRFVNYMKEGYTIGDAWIRTTQDWQDSFIWAAMLGVGKQLEGEEYYYGWDDHLPGYGSVGEDLEDTWLAWREWQC